MAGTCDSAHPHIQLGSGRGVLFQALCVLLRPLTNNDLPCNHKGVMTGCSNPVGAPADQPVCYHGECVALANASQFFCNCTQPWANVGDLAAQTNIDCDINFQVSKILWAIEACVAFVLLLVASTSSLGFLIHYGVTPLKFRSNTHQTRTRFVERPDCS